MLNNSEKQKYVSKHGVVCPYCDSNDITSGRMSFCGSVDNEILCEVNCFSCGKEWSDVYKLADVVEKEG